MTYTIVIRRAAHKVLASLQPKDRERVLAAIQALATSPRPDGCVKLEDRPNAWRVRVGRYRVLYQINDDALIVTVTAIGHRRDIYRN